MTTKLLSMVCLVGLFWVQAGCSDDTTTPSSGIKYVSITGTVNKIVDDVPVDGGATVYVGLGDGGTEVLFLPSLRLSGEEDLEVYRVIGALEIGDRVKALGQRTEAGVRLRRLTKL